MQLGAKKGPWEIELKIPQKHIGQVLRGFERIPEGERARRRLRAPSPTRRRCSRASSTATASPARPTPTARTDDAEPVVLAYVRIDGDDIPEDYRADIASLISGTEVRAKIHCGNARAGYSLFYGVWEFLYEKVVFYLF